MLRRVILTEPQTAVILGAGASADAGVPMASGLTESALHSVPRVPAFAGRTDERLAVALAYVVSSMQRQALFTAQPGSDNLGLPGIESVVSTIEILHGRQNLEISGFIGTWDAMIASVDPLLRRVNENSYSQFFFGYEGFDHETCSLRARG